MTSRKDKFLPSLSSKEGPNFSIRFNPSLHDSDDEDEDLFSISDTLKLERKRAATLPAATDSQKRPSSISVTGGNNSSESAGKFSNLIDEIKEKIADPLNSISEKINSLSPLQSPNSQPTSPRRQSDVGNKISQYLPQRKFSDSGININSASSPARLTDIGDDGSPPNASKPPLISVESTTPPKMTAVETVEKPLLDLKNEIENLLSFDSVEKPKKYHTRPRQKKAENSDLDKNYDDIFSEPLEDFLSSPNAEIWHDLDDAPKSEENLSNEAPPTFSYPRDLPTYETRPAVAMTMSSLLSCSTPEDETIDGAENSNQLIDLNQSTEINQYTDQKINQQSIVKTDQVMTNFKQKLSDLPHFPLSRVVLSSILLFIYLIVPWPPYVSGMIVGAVVTATSIALYLWWIKEPTPREPFEKFVPPLEDLPPLVIPEIKDNRNSDGVFRGWMNELPHYEAADYHINQTNSVYLTLENTTLRLQRPRHNVPKRAMWDETSHNPRFIHQRYYDLTGCTVRLVPGELVKKRIWSKKYPICLIINKQKQTGVAAVTKSASAQNSFDDSEFEKGFEFVSKEACDEVILYLFSRTNREKEEWYRRFTSASRGVRLNTRLSDILKRSVSTEFKRCRQNSSDSVCSDPGTKETASTTVSSGATQDDQTLLQQEYAKSMAKVIPADETSSSRSRSYSLRVKDMPRASVVGHISCDAQMYWFNALLTRTFWDFIRDKYYADKVSEKIQKKLSKIRVPYFIDELTITDIEMGTEMPVVRRATKPYLDERGMWFDADIAYNGGFSMTLETKVNLMKFKRGQQQHRNVKQTDRSAITHSDEEDSVESSSDSDTEENTIPTTSTDEASAQPTNSTQKKLLRIVDKITQSKYFQQATEIKYIKKAMEEVSNTPIILSVEVHSLVGVLTVNIPPPPTDRVWYGFRTNPRLWISAKPKVGERAVTVTHITEWIEKKLALEFQKVFVLPNMDDLVLPVMNQGHVENSS